MRTPQSVWVCITLAFLVGVTLIAGLEAQTTTGPVVAIVVNLDNVVNNLPLNELKPAVLERKHSGSPADACPRGEGAFCDTANGPADD